MESYQIEPWTPGQPLLTDEGPPPPPHFEKSGYTPEYQKSKGAYVSKCYHFDNFHIHDYCYGYHQREAT